MSELRIGVQVRPQHADFDRMQRAWREAEEIGADMVFTWDHFFPLFGDRRGKHFESLACQAALAGATERAQVGALVMCNSYRNPQYLADALRTIDHIAGGRLIVGIGSGWFQTAYDGHGFGAAARYRRKVAVLEEHCAAVGRDPSEIAHVWGVPAEDLAVAEPLRAAGVTHFTVGIGGDGQGYDLG